MDNQLFPLPDLGSRAELRINSIGSYERSAVLDFANIRIRDNFNWRRNNGLPDNLYEQELGIPELADGIFAFNGPAEPICGDLTKDGLFYITEGERRYRAIRHLLDTDRDNYPNGKPVAHVEVLLNPKDITDLQRLAKIYCTQNKRTLKPMEISYGFKKLKGEPNNLTHQEIAELVNVSRQSVDNYILATELPLPIQHQIDEGAVKMTNALADYRKSKKGKGEVVSVDLESGEIVEKSADGDEDELLDKQGNSVSSPPTNRGIQEESGSATLAGDSIYQIQADTAKWKQFFHRMGHLREIILRDMYSQKVSQNEPTEQTEQDRYVMQDKLIEMLRSEYTINTK